MLLIAESPPPAADIPSSRHFYRSDVVRPDDRLFLNTVRALYPETLDMPVTDIELQKEHWLKKFEIDGWYMIEALPMSLKHEVTKFERQALIKQHFPELLEHVRKLVGPTTKIILIKSNVFDVTAEPLHQAGFTVMNTELVDYPGRFNQRAYRAKLADLAAQVN